MDDLVEKLTAGVPAIGLHEDNCTEMFDVEDANETMHEAADRITALEAELKTVLDREAATIARYDSKLDALEAENARLAADKAGLMGLLREARVKLVDAQGSYATGNYACNLLTRITAALGQHGGVK